MEQFNPDYLLMAFWLTVFGIIFMICGIAETIQERRERNGHLRKINTIRYRVGSHF